MKVYSEAQWAMSAMLSLYILKMGVNLKSCSEFMQQYKIIQFCVNLLFFQNKQQNHRHATVTSSPTLFTVSRRTTENAERAMHSILE